MTEVQTSPPDADDGATSQQLGAIFHAQRAAQRRDSAPTAARRRDRIDRFVLALLENADELVRALEADFGSRPALFSFRAELLGMLPSIEHTRSQVEEWMAAVPVVEAAAAGIPTFLEKKPKGVVGVIGPWNFPIQLTAQPAIEALAAGNRVMIKFSEIPSRTAEVFARAVARRMDPSEVAVVLGGPATAAAFSDLPFDHLFFTGSPAVGRRVAAAAGRNLVPVTLELGGKNPVVVARGSDLSVAAERIMGNRMVNGGQLCLCPDYVFVPAESVEEFVADYVARMSEAFPDYATSPEVVSIINEPNHLRVVGLIDDARAKGATVVSAIPDHEAARLPDAGDRRIAPAVVLGVTDDMAIASEEIFGPVIVVYPYDDLQDAIDHIADRPHPLAAYWYGPDGEQYRRFLDQTFSGGVTRGDMALHLAMHDVPFGGVGQSGTGYYHGRAGFDEFTHVRAVATSASPVRASAAGTPPYTADDLVDARDTVRRAIDAITSRLAS